MSERNFGRLVLDTDSEGVTFSACGDGSYMPLSRSDVRALRDALTEWLGGAAPADSDSLAPVVRGVITGSGGGVLVADVVLPPGVLGLAEDGMILYESVLPEVDAKSAHFHYETFTNESLAGPSFGPSDDGQSHLRRKKE